MKICVIGGTGHIGSFLTPMLAGDGHDVTVVTTGTKPIPSDSPWEKVTRVKARYQRENREWSDLIRDIAGELVIDILGVDLPSTYEASKPHCRHLINCGSVWMFGIARSVPTPEETQSPCRFREYAARYEKILQIRDQAARDGVAFTAIMPPNICGPGKIPLEGFGGRSIDVHRAHQRGEPVPLPHGCNSLVGPCDASDIAQGFFLAATKRDPAAGEIFNVGSAYALTASQFIDTYGEIYGRPIPIDWVDAEQYVTQILPDAGANFHFRTHMCPDLTKIRQKLGYEPDHTPEEALQRGVEWMREQGLIS